MRLRDALQRWTVDPKRGERNGDRREEMRWGRCDGLNAVKEVWQEASGEALVGWGVVPDQELWQR